MIRGPCSLKMFLMLLIVPALIGIGNLVRPAGVYLRDGPLLGIVSIFWGKLWAICPDGVKEVISTRLGTAMVLNIYKRITLCISATTCRSKKYLMPVTRAKPKTAQVIVIEIPFDARVFGTAASSYI